MLSGVIDQKKVIGKLWPVLSPGRKLVVKSSVKTQPSIKSYFINYMPMSSLKG